MKDFFKPRLYFFRGYNVEECVYLSNVVSWGKTKKPGEPFYKTDKEIAEETNIPLRSIKRIKQKMLSEGFFTVAKRKTTKFLGATPYVVAYEKFLSLGNKQIEKVLCLNGISLVPDWTVSCADLAHPYKEAENTTEYTAEREEGSASSSSSALSFFDQFLLEWRKHTGKVVKDKRIAEWFAGSPDDAEQAVSSIARYVKACEEHGKKLKHPAFYLSDREFAKDYVVDTPLLITSVPQEPAEIVIKDDGVPSEIAEALKKEFDEAVYNSYFAPSKITKDGNKVTIAPQNSFAAIKINELLAKSSRFINYFVTTAINECLLLFGHIGELLEGLAASFEPITTANALVIAYLIT